MLVQHGDLCEDAPIAPSESVRRGADKRGSRLAWGGGGSGGERCVPPALRGADERVAVLGRHVQVRLHEMFMVCTSSLLQREKVGLTITTLYTQVFCHVSSALQPACA